MRLTHQILGPLKVEKTDIVIVVSDLHLNHDKEFVWKYRSQFIPEAGISNVDDYTTYIINSLYSAYYKYKTDDNNVYLLSLGDNCFNDKEGKVANRLLQTPFDHIYSLPGNHPSGIKAIEMEGGRCNFTLISECMTLQLGKQTLLTITHYPVVDTAMAVYGTLCGHCHGSLTALNEGNSSLGRIFDCGVDNALRLKKRPYFTLDECLGYLRCKKDWDKTLQLHRQRKEEENVRVV